MPVSRLSCRLLFHGRQFFKNVMRDLGEGLGPQKVHEVLIRQQLFEGRDDDHEFGVTNPRILDHPLLALALALEGVYQTLGARSEFLLSSVVVAFFPYKSPLVDQSL